MSKTIASNLNTHLQGEVLTVAYLWKVTRTDGTIYGFTTHDRDITYSGLVYSRLSGLLVSDVAQKSDLSVDNVQLTFVLDSAIISTSDLLVGKWDAAVIDLMLINYADTTMGVASVTTGTVGQVSIADSNASAEFRGATQPLSQKIGRRIVPMCDAVLGDSRCGVTLASYTVTGTATSAGASSVVDTSRAEATGYFDNGVLTMTSGASSGLRYEIQHFTAGGTIALYSNLPLGVSAGDTYSMSPGCNKLLKDSAGAYTGDCKAKFNNVVNFQGYAEVPGVKRLSQA